MRCRPTTGRERREIVTRAEEELIKNPYLCLAHLSEMVGRSPETVFRILDQAGLTLKKGYGRHVGKSMTRWGFVLDEGERQRLMRKWEQLRHENLTIAEVQESWNGR